MSKPHFGYTRLGMPVHLHVMDHHPDGTAYARFNKRVAIWLTRHVGTMSCFWLFCCLSLTVLPSVLYAMGLTSLEHVLPVFVLGFGFELLTTWLYSTCIQLVLLPGLMVGQTLQNDAADARTARQFEATADILEEVKTLKNMLATRGDSQ